MQIEVAEFVEAMQECNVLDVRSPGEFEKGHIPGAISFPLFSDTERAEIGTIYKQVGSGAAVDRGMEMVQPKIREMYQEGLSHARNNKLLVHCWRGGQRSQSVAQLLSLSGIEVRVLKKGYKAFRNWVLTQLEKPVQVRVIGGMTGSGKTEILRALRAREQSTLDLEGFADHKGSAFGDLGSAESVSQAQFENDLAFSLKNAAQPMWVEDESRGIGKIILPKTLYESMQAAPLYYIDLPDEVRVQRLINEYGKFPPEVLKTTVQNIHRRLGGKRTQEILRHIDAGRAEDATRILLSYYDKMYQHQISLRDPKQVHRLEFKDFNLPQILDALMAIPAEKA